MIYEHSFAQIDQLVDLSALSNDIATMARRVIHACGMPGVLKNMRYHNDVARSARHALADDCRIFCDCEMVMHGVIKKFLPDNVSLVCTLNDDKTPTLAQQNKTTRSAAAIDLWGSSLNGAIALIGNAPTALFRLLEKVLDENAKPAAIIATPVGFVGAAESKQALIEHAVGIPYFTVTGTQGGSAMAAAALNAITASLASNAITK